MYVKRVLALLSISALLLGCGEAQAPAEITAPALGATESGAAPSTQMTARRTQMWAASCALCHVDGNALAPRVGNAQEWSPRLAKGQQTLVDHTIEGFNAMPPLGYCMACEADDFAAMIDFMTAGITAGEVQ